MFMYFPTWLKYFCIADMLAPDYRCRDVNEDIDVNRMISRLLYIPQEAVTSV